MPSQSRIALRLRYQGGTADQSEMDLYDGSTSLQGFSQALQIATHAFLNGEIVSRATALKGAKMYLHPLRRGSVLVEIVAVIEQYPATSTLVGTFTGQALYDFLKVVLSKASGILSTNPETAKVRSALERDEPFFDELAETLEGSLQRGHRVIGEGVNHVTLERPRAPLVTFNRDTKDWVTSRKESPRTEVVHGNVTRYNSVSRNGRAYIHELGRIVPFRPDGDFPSSKFGLLTWSLHGSNLDLQNRLAFEVKHIRSARGETKRLLLSDCSRASNET